MPYVLDPISCRVRRLFHVLTPITSQHLISRRTFDQGLMISSDNILRFLQFTSYLAIAMRTPKQLYKGPCRPFKMMCHYNTLNKPNLPTGMGGPWVDPKWLRSKFKTYQHRKGRCIHLCRESLQLMGVTAKSAHFQLK